MTPYAERILSLANSRQDGFYKHGVAGRLFSFDLFEFVAHCKHQGVPVGPEELHFILSRLALGTFDTPFTVPHNVAQFMAELAASRSARYVLDPWAGIGLLAATVQKALQPERMIAYTPTQKEYQVLELLEESAHIKTIIADPLDALKSDTSHFDLAIGCPPFGMRSSQSLTVEIDDHSVNVRDEYGFLLIFEACRHLSNNGRGVFIVPDGFFFASGRAGKARHTLERFGTRITAAIELPAGTFQPRTSIRTHIIVLERSSLSDVFTARFPEDAEQKSALLHHLNERKRSAAPQLGWLVPATEFRGFTAIELRSQLDEQARRMGLVPYPFREVFAEVHAPPSTPEFVGFQEKPNAVYLPQMASTAATTTQQNLPERLKSYFQLVVDETVAEAEFVARTLNTPFGQLWRDSLRTGAIIPRISKTLLEQSTFFLPPRTARQTQTKVLDCQRTLSRLRAEISELEAQLWKRPNSVDQVRLSLKTVNHDDRIEIWLDAIPFPLASILWSAHTHTGTLKEQYERKLHFFEALAAFSGVIHLSAYSLHPALWPRCRDKLTEALARGNLSLEMATFGAWKAVVEVFFAETRRLLSSDEDLVFELFKTRNRQVLEMLSSKRLVSAIQATNKLRNDWMGHTGIVSERDAHVVNEALDHHLQTVREVCGVIWDDYQLVLPGDCKVRLGVFHFNARKIMGTRTPFPREEVAVVEPLEDGHLYLKDPSESRGLRLLPLVKVMPSPKTEENACYFYNRRQSDGIRFLSYYFESDAEVVAEFGEVASTLTHLLSDTK